MAIATVNPATGEVVETFEALTDAEIDGGSRVPSARSSATVARASRSARSGSRARGALGRARHELGRLMTVEMGKPIEAAVAEAREVRAGLPLLRRARASASWRDEPVETEARATASSATSRSAPVLAVMPWNFPFWQVFRFAAPALMAGNVGLLKHASNVPQCALAIEDALPRRRLPRGRVPDAAHRLRAGRRAILDDPRVKAATLTGSEPAGRARGASARRSGSRRAVLELGGSDPVHRHAQRRPRRGGRRRR